jgi:hypothetical protein
MDRLPNGKGKINDKDISGIYECHKPKRICAASS